MFVLVKYLEILEIVLNKYWIQLIPCFILFHREVSNVVPWRDYT